MRNLILAIPKPTVRKLLPFNLKFPEDLLSLLQDLAPQLQVMILLLSATLLSLLQAQAPQLQVILLLLSAILFEIYDDITQMSISIDMYSIRSDNIADVTVDIIVGIMLTVFAIIIWLN